MVMFSNQMVFKNYQTTIFRHIPPLKSINRNPKSQMPKSEKPGNVRWKNHPATILEAPHYHHRSQTSDNMERWKAEQGRGIEKRKIRRKKLEEKE